jgi:light-regulated signal transduction histidine kinase (bacteriophytochrome)
MNQQFLQHNRELSHNIMVHQTIDNLIAKQPIININQQLEQKVSQGAAEIVQIAKELAAKNCELNLVNQQLESFAYTVSHDLQEPLRSINLFTQLLLQEYQEDLEPQAQEYLGYIIGSAARMQTLVRDILAYSRVGTSKQTRLNVDLNRLLETVQIDLQGTIRETKAKILVEELPTVFVNPTEISQLFRNLISNSIKFKSDRQPQIKITARLQDNQWLITIEDNGIGIETEYQKIVFQAFKRLHSQEQYSGSGIGLAICQKIVERHQGYIGVQSQPGKGSTFYFTLPKSPVIEDYN